MNNQDFIVSNAMLSAYLGKASADTLDLMKPFVLYLLPDVGEIIDFDEIAKGIKSEFGFTSVPANVIHRIVNRISKDRKYVEKRNGKFYVKTEFEKNTFEKNRREITSKFNHLSEELACFLREKNYCLFVKTSDAKEYIETFLSQYNYLYDSIEQYKKITTTSSTVKSNFWVAKYILDAYEKGSSSFDDFLEIIKGSLASRAITFLANDSTEEAKKLRNTVFYFDTRLLINCLGLSSKEEYRATTELKDLIEHNGGKVRTFETYIDELHGIITKYIKSPSDRAGLSLDYFRESGLNTEFIRTYADSLVSHLNKCNIMVDEKPSCELPIDRLNWPIDPLALKKVLSDNVNYSSDEKGEIALQNDMDTLESISILRYNLKGRHTLEDCKAIFVTQNADITYAAHKYFKNNSDCKGIELAVTEVDLTALLWLSYGRNTNELPKIKLLENAYTACYPNESVINEFSKIVNVMNERGTITDDQVKLIKIGNIDLTTLVDKSSNDAAGVNEQDVEILVTEYLEDLEKKAKKDLQKDIYKLDEDRKEFERQKEKQIMDMDKREKNLDEKESYINNRVSGYQRKNQEYKNNVMRGQIQKAEDDAKKVEKIVLMAGNILLAIIIIGLFILSIIGYLKTFKGEHALVSSIVFSILGFLGAIDIIGGFRKGGAKLVRYGAKKVYVRSYAKNIEENKKYLP